MPLPRKPELFERVVRAITSSGWNLLYLPSERSYLRLQIYRGEESHRLRIYIWNLTPGGRPQLADEFRIQVTSVDRFENVPPEITLILGWWPEQDVFAAFDYEKHDQPLGNSASIQIRRRALEEAHIRGFGIWKKETEIVVAVRPEYLTEYIRYHQAIHEFGEIPQAPEVLEHALQDSDELDQEIIVTPADRRDVLITLRKRSRDVSFRSRVLTAYSNTCSMCGVQLKLVDAAHILPVSVDGSTDETFNGIALCAIHHRAYDRALVTFDEEFRTHFNEDQILVLASEMVDGGIIDFRVAVKPLITLPPSRMDRPHPDLVRRANELRGWK